MRPIAGALALFLLALAGVWVNVAAPCSALDWMPVRDIPARCLIGR